MTEKVFANELKRPRAPSWLPKYGKRVWREITKAQPVDWFRDSDLPLLESYCLQYSQMRECQDALEVEGLVIDTEYGPKENPHCKILSNAATKMNMLATKLRICPNARHSGNVAGNAKPNKPVSTTGAAGGNVRRMFGS